MPALIENTVKTDVATYTFNTREEAESFFLSLKNRSASLADETEAVVASGADSTH